MALVRLELHSRRPYHGGAEFGETGAYERLNGIAYFAADPLRAANRQIVDLDKAERDAEDHVLFSSDFCMLQPLDATRGNGRLLFDVVNRGQKRAPARFNRAPMPPQPSERIGLGDGFLMRRGWTLVWCGWQWDVLRSPALLGLEAPQALSGGRPIRGRVMVEIQVNERVADHILADRTHRPYSVLDPSDAEAELRVRDWPDAPSVVIPRGRWRFAREAGSRPVEDATHIWLEAGFEPNLSGGLSYRRLSSRGRGPAGGARHGRIPPVWQYSAGQSKRRPDCTQP